MEVACFYNTDIIQKDLETELRKNDQTKRDESLELTLSQSCLPRVYDSNTTFRVTSCALQLKESYPKRLCRNESYHRLSVFSKSRPGSRMVQGLPELSTWHTSQSSTLKRGLSQTSAPGYRSVSSTRAILCSLLAASTGGHSRLAGTKSDGFPVCAIAALKQRCRWVREPGTVSQIVSACVTGQD